MKFNYEKLGNLIEISEKKNSDLAVDNLVGMNINKEFIPSVANTIGTNLARYKIIHKDQFACNLMHVGRDKSVVVSKYSLENPSIISPAYKIFQVKDTSIILPDFLMLYFLRSEFDRLGWFYTDSSIRGSLDWSKFCSIEIPVLDIDIQKKIVDIYQFFNDRIELKERINNNLEKISSRLYSNLIYDEKDLEFIELKEICKFIKGRKPKEISEQYKSDFEDYLTIEVLSNQNQIFAFDEKGIKAKEMDILMVMDGASSGKLFYGKKGLVGSTLAKIDVKEDYIELVYQFLKINEKYITENTTGSAIPHTDKGLVLSLSLPISEKLTEYSDKFKNIRLAINSNNNEIMKLQHLRDILLPKLMSGEIDVSKINCDLIFLN